MKQYYRINSILHSGSQGVRGTPKTDEYNASRVNRIIELDDDICHGSIHKGFPVMTRYVKESDGSDCKREYGFISSIVEDWDFIYDNIIRVETCNTIYEFERVDL